MISFLESFWRGGVWCFLIMFLFVTLTWKGLVRVLKFLSKYVDITSKDYLLRP